MTTVEDLPIGELGLFKKKKKKPPPAPPPEPTPPTPPEKALFTASQEQQKASAFPWLAVSLIGASVLVIGVSAFLILRKR